MKYRKEIDGLRALAVLPVIFFHAGYKIFNGGFIGVDIFFVISGYLITTILIEDISKKNFSIIKFYDRRARRILPALFFIMLICIPFAWIWMLPTQMESFSRSLIAVTLFLSNILFWKEGGYFGSPVDEKPLIHSWSLSIEEQYYLLFPIFLIFFWKQGKNKLFWIILAISIISLSLSEWGWRNRPNANFYLTPTRAWELLIGSLTAITIYKKKIRSNNLLSLIGFLVIIISIFVYDNSTPFPSIYTLAPVFGVILIIVFGKDDAFISKILGNKFLVKIGLISYSLYLWHQPLFAFFKISPFYDDNSFYKMIIIFLSFILAFLSWKLIEQPFRNKNKFKRKAVFTLSLIVGIFFIFIGSTGIRTEGFNKYRFSSSDREFLDVLLLNNYNYVEKKFNLIKKERWDSKIETENIILIGDSYAKDLVNSIYESNIHKKISIKVKEIPPRCGNLFINHALKKKYIEEKSKVLCKKYDLINDGQFLKDIKNANQIWFASSWAGWELDFLKLSLKNLSNLTTAKILFFGRKDFPKLNPKKYLGLDRYERSNYVDILNKEVIKLNQDMKLILGDTKFIDTQKIMCGDLPPKCKIFDDKGKLKTWDGAHLTKDGAIWMGMKLEKIIKINK